MNRSRWLAACVFLASVVPPLVALWCVEVLPTHDGPKNLYAAHVFWHAHDPAFAGEFERQVPVTAFGFTLVYGVLGAVLRWQTAYRASITVVALGVCAAHLCLVRALEPKRQPIALLACGAAMQWALYMGFFNYLGSVALALATLAVGLARESWTWRRELAVALLLWAACVFHPFGAQLAGLGLLVFRLLTVRAGRRLRELGMLALMGAPALGATIVASDVLDDLRHKGMAGFGRLSLSTLETLQNFRSCFLPGPAWRAWPVVAAACVGVIAALIGVARRRLPAREIALLVVGGVMLAAALVAPFHGNGWEFFAPRFIPVAVLAGVALVPIERLGRRALGIAIVLGLLFDVASNAWAARYEMQWARDSGRALAGLGAPTTPGRTLFPIVAVPEIVLSPARDRERVIPHSSALTNLGEIYAVDRNALTPYSFSVAPWIHVVAHTGARIGRAPLRDYGLAFEASTSPEARRRELVRLASYGAAYDDVVFYGAEDDADALVRLGYVPDVRRGPLMIARFVGCRARLSIRDADAPVDASFGWEPSDRIAWYAPFPAGTDAIDLPPVPCEGIWVRVFAGAKRCRGADASGALHVAIDRATITPIDCALAPSP